RPAVCRLRCRNGAVGISHDRGGDDAGLEHELRLDAEEGRVPQAQIGKLADLDGADVRRDALRDRGVDRVLRQVASYPPVVVVTSLLGEPTELLLHLVGRLPRSEDDLADTPHRLAV